MRVLLGLTFTLVTLCFLLAIGIQQTFAQSQAIDGQIEGFVKQESGAIIAGARVKATNQNTGYVREAVSDAGGRYVLPLLLPGAYTVTVEQAGFPTVTRKDIELSAGQVITMEFALSTAQVSDSIEITAQVPVVETGRTVVANTYEERVVRSLPTVGRSILDFFVLQPGVNFDGQFGHGHARTQSAARLQHESRHGGYVARWTPPLVNDESS